jgi:hypothetical protein
LRRLLPRLRFWLAGYRPAGPRVLIRLLRFVLNENGTTTFWERGRLARHDSEGVQDAQTF